MGFASDLFAKLLATNRAVDRGWSFNAKPEFRIAALHRELEAVRRSHERLELAVMALAEVLRDHLGIHEETLESKLLEIDLRDGKVDGRLRRDTIQCIRCGRAIKSESTRCLFCGIEPPQESVFFSQSAVTRL